MKSIDAPASVESRPEGPLRTSLKLGHLIDDAATTVGIPHVEVGMTNERAIETAVEKLVQEGVVLDVYQAPHPQKGREGKRYALSAQSIVAERVIDRFFEAKHAPDLHKRHGPIIDPDGTLKTRWLAEFTELAKTDRYS
ncbi:hypothetical protein K2Y00_02860 [Patescibacteria group bacterium]|nr:hypothetical protein [Patescibacteria group bacterium]